MRELSNTELNASVGIAPVLTTSSESYRMGAFGALLYLFGGLDKTLAAYQVVGATVNQ